MKVPAPTFCPECRLQRRLAWRNENGFHNRECGLCGKKIISIYSKDFNNVVYCGDCWYGDGWEAADHWQDIDFSKPFLTQFYELCKKVPAMDLFVTAPTLKNSQYCNMADNLKNCYFLYDGNFDENISYASGVYHSKDSLDLTMARKCELCYESITCVNCYKITHCQQCEDCMNVYFSFGLKGCNNCVGCVNLRQKSYCVFNKQYTKEEYEKYLSSLDLSSYKAIERFKETVINFWKKFPKKFMFGLQNLNVSGDYLEHSKNAKTCFGCANLEDSKFCSFIANGPLKTTYDFTHYGDNVELSYECLQSGDGISNCKLNWGVWTNSDNVEYSFSIHGCSSIFGCVGLKKKKYCILNKQYTKEEYEALVSKIIQHMNDVPYVDKRGIEYRYGEFFPDRNFAV
jgi:Zn ribbon nucleic-acid-binding protein